MWWISLGIWNIFPMKKIKNRKEIFFIICCRYLITGLNPEPLQSFDFYQGTLHDILTSNIFNGDRSYSMVGFSNDILVSKKLNIRWNWNFICKNCKQFLQHKQVSTHSPYEVMNVAKPKFYTNAPIEFLCSSNEMVADETFQRYFIQFELPIVSQMICHSISECLWFVYQKISEILQRYYYHTTTMPL